MFPRNYNDEQRAVIEHEVGDGTLCVNAYAGCTKTTTLEGYALARPRERMLYLAFNQAIKLEAEKRFPKSVKCMTTHGVAFPTHGSRYVGREGKLGNPRVLNVQERFPDLTMVAAHYVLEAVKAFMASADAEITEEHVLAAFATHDKRSIAGLVGAARKLWAAMIDPDDGMMIPHDGYLKAFQLSMPLIEGYGKILFDEGQDANPSTLDIFARQRCGKIIVGDSFQSINRYRGAINALERLPADKTLALTGSYRFGPLLAEVATRIITLAGATTPLRGLATTPGRLGINAAAPHTILARTNATLFAEVAQLIDSKRTFSVIGGAAGIRLDLIMDVHKLRQGKGGITNPSIASFRGFGEMEEYAQLVEDKEMAMLARVAKEYGSAIPRLVGEMKARLGDGKTKPAVPPSVILSTTHKAKGLEWDQVRLADDYLDLKDLKGTNTGELTLPERDEVNILYVAATRARQALELPAYLRAVLTPDLPMAQSSGAQAGEGRHFAPPDKKRARPAALEFPPPQAPTVPAVPAAETPAAAMTPATGAKAIKAPYPQTLVPRKSCEFLITDLVNERVRRGELCNQNEVVHHLREVGYSVLRKASSHLVIADPQGNPARLTGEAFGEGWRVRRVRFG